MRPEAVEGGGFVCRGARIVDGERRVHYYRAMSTCRRAGSGAGLNER